MAKRAEQWAVVEYQDTDIFSPDERMQRTIGPFPTFDAAQTYADKLRSEERGENDIPLAYSVLEFEAPTNEETIRGCAELIALAKSIAHHDEFTAGPEATLPIRQAYAILNTLRRDAIAALAAANRKEF